MCKHTHIVLDRLTDIWGHRDFQDAPEAKENLKYSKIEKQFEEKKSRKEGINEKLATLREKSTEISNVFKYLPSATKDITPAVEKTIDELFEVITAIKLPTNLQVRKNTKTFSKQAKDYVHNKIKKKGRPKKPRYVPDINKPWVGMIAEALRGPSDDRWRDLLPMSVSELEKKISHLKGIDQTLILQEVSDSKINF